MLFLMKFLLVTDRWRHYAGNKQWLVTSGNVTVTPQSKQPKHDASVSHPRVKCRVFSHRWCKLWIFVIWMSWSCLTMSLVAFISVQVTKKSS